MNETDILKSLKQKEEELESLLQEAKEEASRIKASAMAKREEIMASLPMELAIQREGYKRVEMAKIGGEVERIKEEAHHLLEKVKAEAEKRIEEGVEVVLKAIIP